MILLALAAWLSAPGANLLHLLSFQSPTQICSEQGQPGGFYPPGQTPPSPKGSVVLDPLSVHCSYADWLGDGPLTTVPRGWPPTMALLTGVCVIAVVGVVWGALATYRRLARARSRQR